MPNEVEAYPGNKPAELELLVTRTFDAPRELVFEAFTNPVHLMKWWGPQRCTVIACETDVKPGGAWSISMRSPKVLPGFDSRFPVSSETAPLRSKPHPNKVEDSGREAEWIIERQRGRYQEVITPERLVFTYAFEDRAGLTLHQTVVTITFANERGKTRLTLHQATFDSSSAREDHDRGWTQALERLAEHMVAAR